ncbi:MAG: 3'(2'),5'-bisphosphate nucleotidase [Planctomycetota bacterium]
MSDWAPAIEAAALAVSRASAVCRAVQARLDDVRSILKDDKSPVTVADFASQAVVAWTLRETMGSCVMVGEEDAHELREQLSAGERTTVDQVVEAARLVWTDATVDDVLDAIDLGNADPRAHGAYWTLDPIDGTKGFLRDQQYAVALGWIEGGLVTLGALGCPNLSLDQSFPVSEKDGRGSLYLATRGGGVREVACDEPDRTGRPIGRSARGTADPVRMCESAEAGHTSHGAAGEVLSRVTGELGTTAGEPARLDSQAKYAVVARGQADLYLRLPRPGKPYVERIWDHAAGSLVASEAGCAVSDASGTALDFGHGAGLERNAGVVVGDPAVHGPAIEAIGSLGAARA